MKTLIQNIAIFKHIVIFSVFAVVLTACGGGSSSSTATTSSIEEQVIALHAKIDAAEVTEESFISQLAALIG